MNASGFKMYSKASKDAQYELIERYAPLVKRIAYHLLARLPANVQVEDLIQAGVNGYVVKPFTAQVLKEKIEKIFERVNG